LPRRLRSCRSHAMSAPKSAAISLTSPSKSWESSTPSITLPGDSTSLAGGATRPVLEINGLTSHYGRIQALHGINLQVGDGQLVALVGANGAGKTTLLRAISGVQPTSGGEIRLLGESIRKLRPNQRVAAGICQVPEGRQVFGPM